MDKQRWCSKPKTTISQIRCHVRLRCQPEHVLLRDADCKSILFFFLPRITFISFLCQAQRECLSEILRESGLYILAEHVLEVKNSHLRRSRTARCTAWRAVGWSAPSWSAIREVGNTIHANIISLLNMNVRLSARDCYEPQYILGMHMTLPL